MFLEEKHRRILAVLGEKCAEVVGAGWLCSLLSWKTSFFFLCSEVSSFLPCFPWAIALPRSDLLPLNQSPVSSAPVFSTGQPLCLSCFPRTQATLTLPTISFLGPRTVTLLSWPLSHVMLQSDCSLLLSAFPLSCPDTVPGRWSEMLVTISCVPFPWVLLCSWEMTDVRESMHRSENSGVLPQSAHLVAPGSQERLQPWQVFSALLCQMLSLSTVIPGPLFIPGFYSKWNVKRVQMRRDRSGLWGWGEVWACPDLWLCQDCF